ncbi:MAG: rhodanese-like domain-containing protein [Planctomycetota bacterium]
MSVATVSAEEARREVEAGRAVLVDVREPFERRAEHVPESRSCPLSKLDAESLRSELNGTPPESIIFQCRSGHRSAQAAAKAGFGRSMEGGLPAWKEAGGRTVKSSGGAIDIMRQVQITAGSVTAVGTLLGVVVSPWFLIVPAFIGTGLTFAGVSGWCGMAKALALMPWNRVPAAA